MPIDCFNGTRFDLLIKYVYVLYTLNGYKRPWLVDMYREHIRILNGGWELPEKKTVNDFVRSADSLIESIKEEKRELPVEVNEKNVLINNAHRFIIGLLLGRPITFRIKPECNGIFGYDYRFFTRRWSYGVDDLPKHVQPRVLNALQPEWCSIAVLEFVKVRHDVKVVTVFPIANPQHDARIEELLRENGILVYKREILLNDNGRYNYIQELYLDDGEWQGYTRRDKARDTQGKHPHRIYFFIPEFEVDIHGFKDKLRCVYGSRHSLHINDTHSQAIRYAETSLFSVHYLNNRRGELSENNRKMLENFRNGISKREELFCIDSSFVLALYGLREARDLDFLSIENVSGCHNHELKYYDREVEDLILDPRNYFYFRGIKILNLSIVRDMKEKRGEAKDWDDLKLISSIYK